MAFPVEELLRTLRRNLKAAPIMVFSGVGISSESGIL